MKGNFLTTLCRVKNSWKQCRKTRKFFCQYWCCRLKKELFKNNVEFAHHSLLECSLFLNRFRHFRLDERKQFKNVTVYWCCLFKLSFQIKMMLHNEENHTILTQVHTMSYWFHDHTLGVVNNTWFGFLDLFLYPFIGPATVIVYTILFASLAFVVYKIWRSMSYEELSNSYEIVMSFLSAGFAFCMLFVNLTWLVGQVVGSVCDILSAK